jgi:hypothetical protein
MGDTRLESSKGSSLLLLAVVGTLGVSAGCLGIPGLDDGSGGNEGGSGQVEDEVTVTSELAACKSCGAGDVTTFTVNNSTVIGPLTSSHICFATEFQGRTSALGAWLLVDKWSTINGEKWVVQGFGKMSCVPLCCFSHPSASAVRWVSPTFATDSASGCVSEETNMWWGDAAGWVQGLSKTNSTEGFTWVEEAAGAFTPRQLTANNSCDPGSVEGWGLSFFVGVPSAGVQPKLSTGFQSWVVNPSTMIAANKGICYFTNVGAFLPGSGRKAAVQIEGSNWVLRTTGGVAIQAAAQCMFYKQ